MKVKLAPALEKDLKAVKQAWAQLRGLNSDKKNSVLNTLAELLVAQQKQILIANRRDLEANRHQSAAYIDRLTLTEPRLKEMARSLKTVAELADPVGEIIEEKILSNGLKLKKLRAPLGVIFMIFESRPNVAIEAFSMAFKSGNAIILRGGKESKFSVAEIYRLIEKALQLNKVNTKSFLGMTSYDRDLVNQLLKQKNYIDIVVPRGGEKLIAHVQSKSLMPVIKNDRGLCHAYIHEDAELEMAKKIVVNAKTSRPSVCNALESILIHRKLAESFLQKLIPELKNFDMKFFACKDSFKILKKHKQNVMLAKEANFNTEYLDYKVNVKIVKNLEEALLHIEKYGSKHSETIITESEKTAREFQSQVDAAVVYWNASTRFTDGFEMGLGGEIGISTQKLHVRGPVGLKELTSGRWVVDGHGQIRQ